MDYTPVIKPYSFTFSTYCYMSHELKDLLFGTDANKETSLFEYGLLIAPYTKDGSNDEYFVVYSIGKGLFDTGYKHEYELNDLINGKDWADKDAIDSFLSFTGQSLDEWLKLPMIHKLHDCIMYWGYENIMGSGCIDSDFTARTARDLYF